MTEGYRWHSTPRGRSIGRLRLNLKLVHELIHNHCPREEFAGESEMRRGHRVRMVQPGAARGRRPDLRIRPAGPRACRSPGSNRQRAAMRPFLGDRLADCGERWIGQGRFRRIVESFPTETCSGTRMPRSAAAFRIDEAKGADRATMAVTSRGRCRAPPRRRHGRAGAAPRPCRRLRRARRRRATAALRQVRRRPRPSGRGRRDRPRPVDARHGPEDERPGRSASARSTRPQIGDGRGRYGGR